MQNVKRGSLSALVVLACSAGCGTGSDLKSHAATQTGSSSADAGAPAQVVMKTLEFSPTSVNAKVGQSVVWTNEDTSPHNVMYVSGPRFNSSRTLNPGARFSLRLAQPGTIHYYCSLHPWMKAAIVVSK